MCAYVYFADTISMPIPGWDFGFTNDSFREQDRNLMDFLIL